MSSTEADVIELAKSERWMRIIKTLKEQRRELREACEDLLSELRHGQNVPSLSVIQKIKKAVTNASEKI